MSSQLIQAEQRSFKITFRNLQCKINLNDPVTLAFVIRIGKTSSKYTQKKEIHEGNLEFDNVLELPIDQSLLTQKNSKKQKVPLLIIKCEIMLYKFRVNRDKECKELIGMASVAVSSEMFEIQSKRLRLTNSFDKEAYVECKIRIELGEADVLSQQPSQLSSSLLKFDEPSVNSELTRSRAKDKIQSMTNMSPVKISLITSNSHKSLREISSRKSKEENSFLELLNGTPKNSSPQSLKDRKISQDIISNKVEESVKSIDNSNFLEEENIKLKEICKQLQQQNFTLQNTITHLETQNLNQSILSIRSVASQNPQIPKPGTNNKRSPMIKKNTTITVTPSFSKIQPTEIVLTRDVLVASHSQQNLLKPKTPKMGKILKEQASRLNNFQQDNENEKQYFFQKMENTSKFTNQNIDMPLHLTFARQSPSQRHRFEVIPAIEVKYVPPINPKKASTNSNGHNRSANQSSVSSVEKRNQLSYSKFNGKRKYHIVGAIDVVKSQDSSQINMSGFDQELEQNNKREGGSIIVCRKILDADKIGQKSFHSNILKESPFNQFKVHENQQERNFLDFLKEKDEDPFLKNLKDAAQISTPKASMQNFPIPQGLFQERKIQNRIFADGNEKVRSRMTLQELDMRTEENFRKNERTLKIANMKIMQENRTLKKERKMLQQQIEQKKHLSNEEFGDLKAQILQLKNQVKQSIKVKDQSQSRCEQLSKKFTSLQEENAKLKKDLKEQKTKYDYYFKMGNINDDKEKQRESHWSEQKTVSHKSSIGKLLSQTSSPGEKQKRSTPNDRSMTSISNFNKPDGQKSLQNQKDKSFKKADFSMDQIDEDSVKIESLNKLEVIKAGGLKSPTSSTAISKLKMHIKPILPKPQMKGMFSHIHSPANDASSANMMTGLIGTGQTIVAEGPKAGNFFSRK